MNHELIAQARRFSVALKKLGQVDEDPAMTKAGETVDRLADALEQQAGGEPAKWLVQFQVRSMISGELGWVDGDAFGSEDQAGTDAKKFAARARVVPLYTHPAPVQQVDALPTLPFAVFDEFGSPCEDRVRDHFRAALAAQPAAEREPLTEAEFMRVLNKLGPDMHGRIALTYESGPYDIDKPTNVAMRLLRGIEAALGITATSGKESGNG